MTSQTDPGEAALDRLCLGGETLGNVGCPASEMSAGAHTADPEVVEWASMATHDAHGRAYEDPQALQPLDELGDHNDGVRVVATVVFSLAPELPPAEVRAEISYRSDLTPGL